MTLQQLTQMLGDAMAVGDAAGVAWCQDKLQELANANAKAAILDAQPLNNPVAPGAGPPQLQPPIFDPRVGVVSTPSTPASPPSAAWTVTQQKPLMPSPGYVAPQIEGYVAGAPLVRSYPRPEVALSPERELQVKVAARTEELQRRVATLTKRTVAQRRELRRINMELERTRHAGLAAILEHLCAKTLRAVLA